MKVVILSYRGTQRTKEIVLAGVPRKDDHIQLADDDIDAPQLIVDDVLWTESSTGRPTIVVTVHPHRPTIN